MRAMAAAGFEFGYPTKWLSSKDNQTINYSTTGELRGIKLVFRSLYEL